MEVNGSGKLGRTLNRRTCTYISCRAVDRHKGRQLHETEREGVEKLSISFSSAKLGPVSWEGIQNSTFIQINKIVLKLNKKTISILLDLTAS